VRNVARTDHVTNVYKNYNQTCRGMSLLGDTKTRCEAVDCVARGGNVSTGSYAPQVSGGVSFLTLDCNYHHHHSKMHKVQLI